MHCNAIQLIQFGNHTVNSSGNGRIQSQFRDHTVGVSMAQQGNVAHLPNGQYRRFGEASNPGPGLKKRLRKDGRRGDDSPKLGIFFANITSASDKAARYLGSRPEHILGIAETHTDERGSEAFMAKVASDRDGIYSPARRSDRSESGLQGGTMLLK